MPSLAETQRVVRDAVVTGEVELVRPLLVGGTDPSRRLAIHHRHYHASLVATLINRFPGLAWLAGGARIADAAGRYVSEHPPVAPVIAEYGERFPAFVQSHASGPDTPYLQAFGELEWYVGAVSIAVDVPAIEADILTECAGGIADAHVILQPGLRYLRAGWAIDELMKIFLTESAPDAYVMHAADTRIEVRGARGDVGINALDAATWTFRSGLQGGLSLETAATNALHADSSFEPGRALETMFAERLITAVRFPSEGISS